MSKKKKVKRKRMLAISQPERIIGLRGTWGDSTGEEVLQMQKDITQQESDNKGESYSGGACSQKKVHTAQVHNREVHDMKAHGAGTHIGENQNITAHEKAEAHEKTEVREKAEAHEDNGLGIRDEVKVADPLLMQLEEEVTVFINRRLEEHVAKRIKGLLVPVAKLSLKVQKIRKKLTGERGDAAASHLLDLEDDLDYILENSKLKRISPQVGEKFNPALHEEVDFSWNADHGESAILAVLREGFFWEYNQEMVIKPQVVVNRRISI
ncbi:MAG: nucleotide exchange factor GrpE [bacterium]